ncbi:MAG: alginate export family protein [Planctomycetota bacterium]
MRALIWVVTLGLWWTTNALGTPVQEGPEAPASEPRSEDPQDDEAAAGVDEPEPNTQEADPQSSEETKTDLAPEAARMSNVSAPKVEWLELGGQFRAQFEYRDPAAYVVPGTFGTPLFARGNADDDLMLMRTRLHADARINENLRAFVQLQDFRFWGAEAPPTLATTVDDEGVDIHQAFVDLERLFDVDFGLRIGRQELSYGDQRLVSPLDWRFRAFDAIKARYRRDDWTLDVFASNVLEGTSTNRDRMFNGAYFTWEVDEEAILDVYLFQRMYGDRTFAGERGGLSDLEDYTLGGRYARRGDLGGAEVDFTAEGAFQFGSRGGDHVEAFAWALKGGVTLDEETKFRIGAEWAYATGDEDPLDGNSNTFVPLFPFGHFFHGYYDQWVWSNGHDLAFSASFWPHEDLKVQLDWHNFWLDDTQDAWYAADLTPIRRDPTGSARRYVGSEIDLTGRWNIQEQVSLWFGYSFFQPGTYVRDTGSAPVGNFIFAQLTVDF